MFMFACSLAFMLSCTLVFAAGLGLGDGVTIDLVFPFEFSAVVHAAPKTANASKNRKLVVRRMSVPPMFVKISRRY